MVKPPAETDITRTCSPTNCNKSMAARGSWRFIAQYGLSAAWFDVTGWWVMICRTLLMINKMQCKLPSRTLQSCTRQS